MPLKHVHGVDHAVITVRDLDASAQLWRDLGFTVSPRGTHSAILGTGNYTIMFGEDYLELLGILTDTEHNRPTQEYLRKGEGIERVAFTTDDAAAGAEELKARGLAPLGPVHFGRPVDLPNGGTGEARFNVYRWPLDQAPGGMRIFACQHLTRETVWIPELQRHANGASRLVRIEVLSDDAKAAAAQLSGLIDQPAEQVGDAWRVRSGNGRADFLFYDAAGFASRYPEAARQGGTSGGVSAIVIQTADLAGATKALGANAIAHDGAVSAPASAANGIVVSFVAG
jgi:catechol 2,3-dioxygenase-like lactoylglutathione lyase family enzyme